MTLSFFPVESEQQKLQARELIWEYLQWINEGAQREYGIKFDVEAMIDSDFRDGKYGPPFGRFYLVQFDGLAAGVGCLACGADRRTLCSTGLGCAAWLMG